MEGLLELAGRHLQGPSPTFDRARVILAFSIIGENGRIGRSALAASSGLGEGAIRTLLKKLRDDGYVSADASGCHLTRGGERVYVTLADRISRLVLLHDSRLTVGDAQAALAVRGRGGNVRSGIEQRDSAIMSGAAGATTYVIKGEKFTVPGGSSDCEKDFPSGAWTKLRKETRPRDSDAVILCGARTEVKARLGVLAAALTLL